MSEGTTTTTETQPTTPITNGEPQDPGTPAGAINTDTKPEIMIPKQRFDEVNDRLKALEAEREKAAAELSTAEKKRLAEEGKFRELYEKQQAELETERKARRDTELRLIRQQAASETKLPAILADRLQGETLEEMVADAKKILASLPKPPAPDINPGSGGGAAPKAGELTPEQKAELASAYGVNPKFM